MFWVIISIVGLRSIASRNASSVRRYMICLLLVLISRIVFYFLMDREMKSKTGTDNWYCDAIYEGGFYIISAIMEAFLILLTLFLSKKVGAYIRCNSLIYSLTYLLYHSVGRSPKDPNVRFALRPTLMMVCFRLIEFIAGRIKALSIFCSLWHCKRAFCFSVYCLMEKNNER